MIVTINDVRESGLCVRGIKQWFVRHNLDFNDFVMNGIDDQVALDAGDEMAAYVINRKMTDG